MTQGAGGKVYAQTLTLGTDSELGGTVEAKNIAATGKTLTASGSVSVEETIAANISQTGGAVAAKKVSGAYGQTGGTFGAAGKDAEITGKLTQGAGGKVYAQTLTLGTDSELGGTVAAKNIAATGKTLTASGSVSVEETIAANISKTGGAVAAKKVSGAYDQTG